jgi:hypothetical protein
MFEPVPNQDKRRGVMMSSSSRSVSIADASSEPDFPEDEPEEMDYPHHQMIHGVFGARKHHGRNRIRR